MKTFRIVLLSAVVAGCSARTAPAPYAGAYDVVIVNGKIIDGTGSEKPHQLSIGMRYVLVNGVLVLSEGTHTGATPGRALKFR